jgi:hypothetical protein
MNEELKIVVLNCPLIRCAFSAFIADPHLLVRFAKLQLLTEEFDSNIDKAPSNY